MILHEIPISIPTKPHSPHDEYDNCTFIGCDLSNTNLSGTTFLECHFKGCNLSTALVRNTSFKEVTFTDCKLLGVNFSECNDFLLALSFSNCLLNLSSFFQLKLPSTNFQNCSLHETDFIETDLSKAVFDNCDMYRAVFENSNLEKADFRSSYNFIIDPERNKLKRALFSTTGIAGLLQGYDIIIE